MVEKYWLLVSARDIYTFLVPVISIQKCPYTFLYEWGYTDILFGSCMLLIHFLVYLQCVMDPKVMQHTTNNISSD
jgi:membrane protein required for beta-lactamase induction